MPMCDAYIPKDALSAEAERKLLSRVTDLLLEHEGADPSNEQVRSIAWLFVHRPEIYVAGAPGRGPTTGSSARSRRGSTTTSAARP